MSTDQILWLLAAISFGCGGLSVTFKQRAINWMLIGFMFASLTFVF